jgi:hypothetical protein
MLYSKLFALLSAAGLGVLLSLESPAPACCPAPPSGKPVVNADQAVIILWDAATKTQHFIRRASFKSQADDFGFLIPTPSQPELNESGNDAFPYLQKLTEPELKNVRRPSPGISCGCGAASSVPTKKAVLPQVKVLEEKLVAGFKAVVLEARSTDALVHWLRENGYAFSPEVAAWAKPYVDAGWKITALKVAKAADGKADPNVTASALRMTFQTDRPLFPYREPDSHSAADILGAKQRLLRIYFLAEARYQGKLTRDVAWTGQVAWAGPMKAADREKALQLLKLPPTTGPAAWWLTEFEDRWPYQVAPADVYFSRAPQQTPVTRPPIIQYVSSPWPTDAMVYTIALAVIVLPVLRRVTGPRAARR